MKTNRLFALLFAATVFFTARAEAVLYWGRAYEPNLQRWIQRDPIGEAGGINLHLFNGNDPINNVDPLGLYVQFTTTDGLTYVIGDGYSDLTGNLQRIIDRGQQVNELKISGHGAENLISLDRFGNNFLTATDTGILTGDDQDITQLLNKALTKDARIYLNGCNTGRGKDNLAQQFSRLLPGRTVTGQRHGAIGFTGNMGFTIRGERYELDIGGLESLPAGRVIGRKGYYRNGDLTGKGWLWNGF